MLNRRSEPDDFFAVARGEFATNHLAVALCHFFFVFVAVGVDGSAGALGEVVRADGGGGVASGAGGEQQSGGEGCEQGFSHGFLVGLVRVFWRAGRFVVYIHLSAQGVCKFVATVGAVRTVSVSAHFVMRAVTLVPR